jgi:hypothetical protein
MEHPISRRSCPLNCLVAAGALVCLVWAGEAHALAGTHGQAVSTWDTTLSTVAFNFHNSIVGPGHLLIASYHANFTSTTGKLSSQFGLHYLNYRPDEDAALSHGIGGTAMAVYGVPVASRYDNGLPKAAFTFFFGGAPAVLSGQQHSYMTIAIPLGFALPLSPSRHVSIVPWAELAPSVNVDSVIGPYEVDESLTGESGDIPSELSPEQVQAIMAESVDWKVSVDARFRAGLALVFHLGDKVDLAFKGNMGHLGPRFAEGFHFFVGGALVFAWDDPPTAVLPEEERLKLEGCPAIYKRFKKCPYYKKLIRKIQKRTRAQCPAVEEPVCAPAPADRPPRPPKSGG